MASLAPTPVARPRVRAGRSRGSDREAPTGRVVEGPLRERHEVDYPVVVATVGLAALGILMITSTQGAHSADGNIFGAVTQQIVGLGLGVAALVVLSRMDYRHLRLVSVPLFLVAVVFLAVLLIPGEGIGPLRRVIIGGAARWLSIGSLPTFHPAELGKLALIIYLAHWLDRRGTDISSLRHGTLPFVLIAGLAIALVAAEPDLGTTGVFALVAFSMFFVAGGRVLHLAGLALLGVVGLAAFFLRDYQYLRIQTWLDPWSVASTDGHQTVQGLVSLASGGIIGTGLGQSGQPGAVRVPNDHNDFIFAIIGQELGLVGTVIVVGLFALLAWRGVRIAMAAPDTFGALLAYGVTAWLVIQGLINIGVVTTLLPLTGIPLPFVSSGATSLVLCFAGVGILLSVSRETVTGEASADAAAGRGGGHRRPHLPRPRRAAGAG